MIISSVVVGLKKIDSRKAGDKKSTEARLDWREAEVAGLVGEGTGRSV